MLFAMFWLAFLADSTSKPCSETKRTKADSTICGSLVETAPLTKAAALLNGWLIDLVAALSTGWPPIFSWPCGCLIDWVAGPKAATDRVSRTNGRPTSTASPPTTTGQAPRSASPAARGRWSAWALTQRHAAGTQTQTVWRRGRRSAWALSGGEAADGAAVRAERRQSANGGAGQGGVGGRATSSRYSDTDNVTAWVAERERLLASSGSRQAAADTDKVALLNAATLRDANRVPQLAIWGPGSLGYGVCITGCGPARIPLCAAASGHA